MLFAYPDIMELEHAKVTKNRPLYTIYIGSFVRASKDCSARIFADQTSTCVASILRLQALHTSSITSSDVSCKLPLHVFPSTLNRLLSDSTVNSLLWCVIEVGTAIMCASLSSLRPLATRLLPKFFSHLTNHSVSVTNRGTKLSTISRSQSHSVLFGSKNQETGESDGQIIIQQTFDISEEWTEGEGKESAVYNRTRQMFDGSSEEDLVNGRKGAVGSGMAR